jgi:CheY-like chemotaxis protein
MVIANKRVLVVDDESIVCQSYQLALTDAGYDVHTVETGQEAIQACRAERFDVMLADLRMPDMDGLEVARVVSRECPELRVVMITGYPTRESAEQASRLGISDYLEKPLSPERLSAATAAALARPARRMTSSFPAAAPDSDVAVSAGPGPRELQFEEAEPEEVAQPRGRATTSNAARQAVLVALGFLAGVTVAYFLAPVHVLAYLMVGTAIASGTILGLFSDAFFAKDARSQTRNERKTRRQAGPMASGNT